MNVRTVYATVNVIFVVGQATSDFCATNVRLLRPAELEVSQQGTHVGYFV